MLRLTTSLATLILAAAPALAQEVNLYSYRQPELLAPLTDAFDATAAVALVDTGEAVARSCGFGEA